MFSRLFRASNGIAAGAIILGLFGLVSRLLGLIRDRLLASTFGAGELLDAYYAAFRVPDFIFNIIVLGALSAGFIPVFSELYEKNKDQAWKFSQAMLFMVSAGLIVLCASLFVGMDKLMLYIAPGFTLESRELATQLSRVMLLSPLLLGVSSVFGGILQSFRRFFAYALAPVFYNLGIIVGIVLFVPSLGIIGLAWGVVLGAFAHFFLQLVVARAAGWHWVWLLPWRTAGLGELLALMGPRTLSIALNEATLFIVTSIGSGLALGSLTLFNFAHNLAHVPIGLFGVSFAVASFPALSTAIAQGRLKRFRRLFDNTISSLLVFLIPTVIVLALFNREIVQLLLGGGQFDASSTAQTGLLLLALTGHMVSQSLIPTYTRAYYAQRNTWYPLISAAFAMVLNAWLAYMLTRSYGVLGLALSLSLSSSLQWLALLFGPRKKANYLALPEVRKSVLQSLVGGLLMLSSMVLLRFVVRFYLPEQSRLELVSFSLTTIFVGMAVYLVFLRQVGSREYAQYRDVFQRRLQALLPMAPMVDQPREDGPSG